MSVNQIIVYVCYDGVKLDKFQNGEGTAVEIVREKKRIDGRINVLLLFDLWAFKSLLDILSMVE